MSYLRENISHRFDNTSCLRGNSCYEI
jgi:hypothetical protein